MRLQIFHKRLEELLGQPEEKKDSLWAYKLCQLSRFAVHKLFECWPDASEVEELYKAFKDLPDMVRGAGKSGPYGDRLDKFADNMEIRMLELRAYIEGMKGASLEIAESGEDEPHDPPPPAFQEGQEAATTTKGIRQRIAHLIRLVSTPVVSHKSD
jgi:hypothetical protein